MYTVYLPLKKHPWCYISLEIDPKNIDVNIHPTKHEVRFLHEDIIVGKVRDAMDEKLRDNDNCRTFVINNTVPKLELPKELMDEYLTDDVEKSQNNNTKVYAKDLVRMDSSEQKLDKFNFTIESDEQFQSKLANEESNKQDITSDPMDTDILMNTNVDDKIKNLKNQELKIPVEVIVTELEKNSSSMSLESNKMETEELNIYSEESKEPVNFKSYSVNEFHVETKLLSILTLRKEVEESYHQGLRVVLSNLIFVGCIDEHSALIQSGSNLYLCDTKKLA